MNLDDFINKINNQESFSFTDEVKGLQFLEEAVTLKYPIAMADLSYFLYHGIGTHTDKKRAKELLSVANDLSKGRYKELLTKLVWD